MTAVPPPPEAARSLFGRRLDLAVAFAALLADSGVSHGLIGPREVPRLWDRHLLNCAVVHEAIPHGSTVIDVGSGAGLPGLVLAIARPDLRIQLVEPLLRRTTWLSAVIEELGLTTATVHRGRAEQFWGELSAPVVTARAVARLGELARWCLPLLEAQGTMLAIKGSRAGEELEQDRAALRGLGSIRESMTTYGSGLVDPAATVVRIEIDDQVSARGRSAIRSDGRTSPARRSRDHRTRPPRRPAPQGRDQ